MDWAAYRKPEYILALALLILAILAYTLIQQRADARKTLAQAQTGLERAEDNLNDLLQRDELTAVKKQLEELKAKPLPSSLPSKESALTIVSALYKRAEEVKARITSFTSNEAIFTLVDERINVMTYNMSATGSSIAVTELVGVITAHSSTVIQALDIKGDAKDPAVKTLSLAVIAAFDPKDAIPAPVTR